MSAENDLLKLGLHQNLKVSDSTSVLRVPGGWLYAILPLKAVVFVPHHSEFFLEDEEATPVSGMPSPVTPEGEVCDPFARCKTCS